MKTIIPTQKRNGPFRLITAFLIVSFSFSVIFPPAAHAQSVLALPAPGTLVSMSPSFQPAIIKGINVHPDNPLQFDFIIDRGDTNLDEEAFKAETSKLIKYFLASLTVPENEIWVNLSPYEKDRIIPGALAQTEMGRDLLAQDYMLKQLSSSLTHPNEALGKKFWDRVHRMAKEKFGASDIPMDTFNKIWIVPEQAFVYEHSRGAFVVNSHLKVMLEEDYLALNANKNRTDHGIGDVAENEREALSGVSLQIVREVLIPEIEREVNQGKTFANLRQIYHSVILATWYKQALKESLLGQNYVNQNITKGIDLDDKEINQKIYDQYVEAFKKGVFDFIREDYDPATQEIIPRKYFSGGATVEGTGKLVESRAGKGTLGSPASEISRSMARLPDRVRSAVRHAASAIKGATLVTVTIVTLGIAGTANAQDFTDVSHPLHPLNPISPLNPVGIWSSNNSKNSSQTPDVSWIFFDFDSEYSPFKSVNLVAEKNYKKYSQSIYFNQLLAASTRPANSKSRKEIALLILQDKDQPVEIKLFAASLRPMNSKSRDELTLSVIRDRSQPIEVRLYAASIRDLNSKTRSDLAKSVINDLRQSDEIRLYAASLLHVNHKARTKLVESISQNTDKPVSLRLYAASLLHLNSKLRVTLSTSVADDTAQTLGIRLFAASLLHLNADSRKKLAHDVMNDETQPISLRIYAAAQTSILAREEFAVKAIQDEAQPIPVRLGAALLRPGNSDSRNELNIEVISLPVINNEGDILYNDSTENLLQAAQGNLLTDQQRTQVLNQLQERYVRGEFDGNNDVLVKYIQTMTDFDTQKNILERLMVTVSNPKDILDALVTLAQLKDDNGNLTPIGQYVQNEILIPMLKQDDPNIMSDKYALEVLAQHSDPEISEKARQQLDDLWKTKVMLIGSLIALPLAIGLLIYWYRQSKQREEQFLFRAGRNGLMILLGLSAFQAMANHADASVRQSHKEISDYAISQGIDPDSIAPSQLSAGEQFAQLQKIIRESQGIPEAADSAMLTAPGGIDLNPETMSINLERAGDGVEFPEFPEPFTDMHIDSASPSIINIIPISNLPLLLGLAVETGEAPQLSSVK